MVTNTELIRTTMFLTKDQHEKLRELAFEKRKSMSSLLREAVLQMLEDEEDIRDGMQALADEVGTITLEEYEGQGKNENFIMNYYRVTLRRAAQKQLDKILGQPHETISTILHSLEAEPRPPNVGKLQGSTLWKIRVGEYRIIFAVDDNKKDVIVVKICKRNENTYRNLSSYE